MYSLPKWSNTTTERHERTSELLPQPHYNSISVKQVLYDNRNELYIMYPDRNCQTSAHAGVFGLLISCSEADKLPFKDMYTSPNRQKCYIDIKMMPTVDINITDHQPQIKNETKLSSHIDIYLTVQLDVNLILPNLMNVHEINTWKIIFLCNSIHNDDFLDQWN